MLKLLLYFLAAYIVIAYIVPFITTIIQKLFYYIRIKIICRKNKYKIFVSFFRWLFSSMRNETPEMFIKTEEAVYSVKNYGFYKKPNYIVFHDKNNIEVQIIRIIYFASYAIIKNIKIKSKDYNAADKYFGEHGLPVINIILFCPKCVGLSGLSGKFISEYNEYINSQYAIKIFGKTILKAKNIAINPYQISVGYKPVPDINGLKVIGLNNGDMAYGAYVYNAKSFIKQRLQSSDMLVNGLIEEERRKIETRESYRTQ